MPHRSDRYEDFLVAIERDVLQLRRAIAVAPGTSAGLARHFELLDAMEHVAALAHEARSVLHHPPVVTGG